MVAEFFYGFGNNDAGANVSNLEGFLASLRKQAPAATLLVLVGKDHPPTSRASANASTCTRY